MARTHGAATRQPGIPREPLPPRAQECAAQVADGLNNCEIALRLDITVGAVENYMALIYAYYGIEAGKGGNRVKLAHAIQDDLVLARIMGEA